MTYKCIERSIAYENYPYSSVSPFFKNNIMIRETYIIEVDFHLGIFFVVFVQALVKNLLQLNGLEMKY